MNDVQKKENKRNIIYTQSFNNKLVIGERKDINGRRALEVKNHQKVDYIFAEDLVKMLFSPL